MDGTSLEQKLVPEIGQTTPTVSDPAPAPQPAPGQEPPKVEPPAAAPSGQGDPQPPEPTEEMIPMSQYKELQRGFTKKSMELAQLKKQGSYAPAPEVPTVQPQYIPQQQAQPVSGNPLSAMVQRLVQEEIAQVVTPIQQQQQDLRIQSKIMELSGNKDFGDVAQTFVDMLDENPELLDLENGLDIAYKAARASVLEKAVTARVQAATAASQQVVAQKVLNTDTTPIVKPAAPNATQTDADAIKQSIMEVGRRHPIFG